MNPSNSPSQLIDLSYLNELGDGDQDFIKSMIETFLSNVPPIIESMAKLRETKSWSELAGEIHKLSPTLKYLGVKNISELIQETETNCKSSENLDQIDRGVNEIISITEKVLDEAKSIITD